MTKLIIKSLGILILLTVVACQKSTNPDENTLELDTFFEEQAAVGWEINDLVSSSNEITELTGNANYIEESETSEYTSLNKLKSVSKELTGVAHEYLMEDRIFLKVTSDSLLYYKDNTVLGIREALYYDPTTSLARYYRVKYKFLLLRNITYDSTQIVFDLRYTRDDPSDDLLKSVYHEQLFQESFFINLVKEELEITSYEGKEPSAFVALSNVYYDDTFIVSQVQKSIQINSDHSGTLRKDSYFKDGTSSYRSVTFRSNQTGEFEKQLRDGTMISGTFDSAEDDLEGYYTETIDFPDGRYLDKIFKSATVTIELPDSTLTAAFSKYIYFSDSRIDSANIGIKVQSSDDIKTTILSAKKPNGAHGTLTIVEYSSGSSVEGNWTTLNAYYILLKADYYLDGAGHIHYDVYQSEDTFLNGDSPLLTADYYLSPDQTGEGLLTKDNILYKIIFKQYGKAIITQDGNSKEVNLYR